MVLSEMDLIELERREEADGPGPRLWDATPGVCCAAFQLGACVHTEAQDAEFYAELEAEWRRDNPEAAAADDAEVARLIAQREADHMIEEPF